MCSCQEFSSSCYVNDKRASGIVARCAARVSPVYDDAVI